MKEEKDTIQKIVDDIKRDEPQKERDPLHFVLGTIFLIIGLFILSKKVVVTSGFYGFSLWGFNMGFSLTILPFIIGIAWILYNPKSIWAKILTILSVILIFVGVIMNTNIHLMHMSLFDYLIIIALIAIGIGLLLRYYFKLKK